MMLLYPPIIQHILVFSSADCLLLFDSVLCVSHGGLPSSSREDIGGSCSNSLGKVPAFICGDNKSLD